MSRLSSLNVLVLGFPSTTTTTTAQQAKPYKPLPHPFLPQIFVSNSKILSTKWPFLVHYFSSTSKASHRHVFFWIFVQNATPLFLQLQLINRIRRKHLWGLFEEFHSADSFTDVHCQRHNAFLSDSFFESDKIQRILSKNLILLIWFIQRMNQISKDPQKQYMDTFWFSKVRESYSLIVQSFFVCLFLIVFHYRNSRRRLFSLKVL